jgi:hypothetical protein
MFNAKGAASSRAWGNAPGIVIENKCHSAEGAIQSGAEITRRSL